MRFLPFALLIVFTFVTNGTAADYNYLSPEQLKQKMETNADLLIVDIQVEEEFQQQHLQGSMPTYAYPAKSASDTAKLDAAVQKQQETDQAVVIVCPRGKGGAKRSYDYLKENGVAEEKLLILEKGMGGWPYPELTVAK